MRNPEREKADWARAAKEARFIRQDTVNSDVFWFKAKDYTYWTFYKPNGNVLQRGSRNDQFIDLYREISNFVIIS